MVKLQNFRDLFLGSFSFPIDFFTKIFYYNFQEELAMKCQLDKDINSCPFFDSENLVCNNPNKCSFQETMNKDRIKNKYIRSER